LAKLEQRAAARVPPISGSALPEASEADEEKRRFGAELVCRIAARRGRHLDLETVLAKQRARDRVFDHLFRSKEERSQKLLPLLQHVVKRTNPPDRDTLLADLQKLEAEHAVMTLAYFIRSFDRLTPLLGAAGLIPPELAGPPP
jgi:hypothetical protein